MRRPSVELPMFYQFFSGEFESGSFLSHEPIIATFDALGEGA
jgi:hypothetical protein